MTAAIRVLLAALVTLNALCTVTATVDANSTSNSSIVTQSAEVTFSTVQSASTLNATTTSWCSENVTVHAYVLLDNGSVIVPENRKVYDSDVYYINDTSVVLCSDEPLSNERTQGMSYNFSEEFLECVHILLDPNEFEMLGNKSIYVDIYFKLYGTRNYYLQTEGAYVCAPQFNNTGNSAILELSKFSNALGYTSYVGISVSIISLLLHQLVFFSVSSVRNLPGWCLASLSFSLLMAYICFISSSIGPAKNHCASIGVAMYYFFLASFFWMNVISFDVWRSFRVVVKEFRILGYRVPRRRFLAYSAYGWLVPAAFAVFAIQADSLDLMPEDFRPSFGQAFCWFGKRKALLVFFACPLLVIMLVNAVLFIDCTCVINMATMKTSQANAAVLRKRFFTFTRLALIMGLTWIVGVLAGYVNNEPLWYVFVILNTLQGLFIFVVFSCSSKVKDFFFRKLGKSRASRQGTSVRTISQVSATI